MSEEQPLMRIGIGQLAVAGSPTIMKATLGSCVGVALLWRERGAYGLAHCLLPEATNGASGMGARYVDQAIDSLLRLLKAEPGRHAEIEAHIAGGGNMMQRAQPAGRPPHIGQLNIEAAMRHLAQRGIAIRSADVGGSQARQMLLDCARAEVSVLRVPVPTCHE